MSKRIVLWLMFFFMISCGISQATVTLYTNQGDFYSLYPGLPVEDFEEAAYELSILDPPKWVMPNDVVLNEMTDNQVYDQYDILHGLEIYSSHAETQKLVVLGAGYEYFGFVGESVTISNNNDASRLNLSFPEGVTVVGFDLFYEGPDVGIKVFNAADELLTGNEFVIVGNFFGIYSSEPISRIEIDSPSGINNGYFEYIDNVAFGDPSPEEKIDALINFFEESVQNGTIDGAARGWLAKIEILSEFWKNLRAVDYLIVKGRIRLACQYLSNAERQAQRKLTGVSVDTLVDWIHDLREDLGCITSR